MKNAILTLAAILLSLNVFSQNDDSNNNMKNEIGIVFSDLINGAFQFKYERQVGDHISVGLGFGYKGDNGLIKLSGLDTESIKTDNLTYSGLKIIPEFRYYLKKTSNTSMDGFYFGAYGKYSNFKSDLDGTYTDSDEEQFSVEFDAKINVVSIGFMAGYKLQISERFNIDFLIAGPGMAFHDYSLTRKKPLPSSFYDDINDALSQYSIFDLIDGDFNFRDRDNPETSFSAISFRYGMTLGYSF